MCEYACRCILFEYKGLEFKFKANSIFKDHNTNRYILFFRDYRQASDFIIKFFLNGYVKGDVKLSLDNRIVELFSPCIEIKKAVI